MYDGDYNEDTAGYDYINDGGESEARREWIPAEIEEFSKCEDNEDFIEAVKNYNRKYGKQELPSEPKSEPKDFADGLVEFIESKAGRPISELYDKNGGDEDVDVKQLYKEIKVERDKLIEAELNNPEYFEKAKQEAVEIYSQIPMYDFGLGQMSNEYAMSEFYGSDLVERVKSEIRESCNLPDHIRKTGQISEELWQELKDIRAGKKPRPKSTIKKKNNYKEISEPAPKLKSKKSQVIEIAQRERQPGDDYYLRTERGVIRNSSYRKFFQGRGIVYEWLWANLVRSEWIDTKGYPIKENYFDKGFLAYCSTPGKIGTDCGIAKNTVIKYINEFEKAGILKVEHLIPKDGKRGQSVFILGTWEKVKVRKDGKLTDTIVEHYFRDEIFLSEKSVKN